MDFPTVVSKFWAAWFEQAATYLFFALPFFLVFWVVWKKKFRPIRIQETERANGGHFRHDLLHSFSSFFVFAALDIVLLYLQGRGYTLLYKDPAQYGWWWLGASFLILLFLNDTYFYWTHRAMHHPKLYNFFHKAHHKSTDPSPLTAFAFHPAEAVVEYGMSIILPFVMPLHISVIIAWQVVDMLNNVLGHLGYELYPAGWTKTPVLRHLTTSTHHNMHHEQFNGNYALYFTWWDKWMGTEFKDYEARHEQVFKRQSPAVEAVSEPAHTDAAADSDSIQVRVQLNGQPFRFEAQAHETLLESALREGVPLPFSCRQGRCGACRMKCVEGAVSMRSPKALSPEAIAAGYILTCQSTPQTPVIVLSE
jgi:sterol desaturase/sphingolipid hydroxylase (fatty acid hydroxylase superfamily)/ferredoxin